MLKECVIGYLMFYVDQSEGSKTLSEVELKVRAFCGLNDFLSLFKCKLWAISKLYEV